MPNECGENPYWQLQPEYSGRWNFQQLPKKQQSGGCYSEAKVCRVSLELSPTISSKSKQTIVIIAVFKKMKHTSVGQTKVKSNGKKKSTSHDPLKSFNSTFSNFSSTTAIALKFGADFRGATCHMRTRLLKYSRIITLLHYDSNKEWLTNSLVPHATDSR